MLGRVLGEVLTVAPVRDSAAGDRHAGAARASGKRAGGGLANMVDEAPGTAPERRTT
ncbi:MAG TPA: hypothetical protein VMT79_12780 [Candidatus Binatia bacterium]|nr:hypothetical protein [Candidatus Binatia bacterium]